MTDDAIDWVTVKIPEPVRDEAREDPRTYGDIMADGLDAKQEGEPLYEAGNDEPVDELATRIVDQIGSDVGGPQVDDSEIAREVAAQLDYVNLAEKTAEQVVGELQR